MHERIVAGDFPSAVYLLGARGQAVFADALGDAVREPRQLPATLETIYDLASLTKPLVTGLLCAHYVEAGELKLDAPVAAYLSEFDLADKRTITIRHLLTHTSGLPAWRPLYLIAGSKGDALAAIAREPLATNPGARVVYSDLGFITLGFILQQITGSNLEVIAHEQIFAPLRLTRTFFNPEKAAQTGIAACETGNGYEREMCARDFPAKRYESWREQTVWGEVHDGNAYFLGGVAGHAGLFSSALETLKICNQFIASQSQILKPETCQIFQQNLTDGLNEARSFAWQLAMTNESTAGPGLPPNAFGHTGFTGTSCWIDGEAARVFILLTNRTHARALPFANINSVRRTFHTLAVKAFESEDAVPIG